jgi:integrase
VKKPSFPITVREGHIRAKIYRYSNRDAVSYTVVWYEGEARKRKVFGDLDEAKLHAQARVGQLANGTAQVLRLDGEELLAYVRAREAVAEFGLALDTIAFEYRDAKRLVHRRSLVDVADYFQRQGLLNLPKKTVSDVYTEMMKAKKADGCSERYTDDLESRVSKFVLAFGTRQITSVSGTEIKEWLQGLQHSTSRVDPNAPKVPVTNRTRNNFRLCIQALFSFARAQRYLPGDWKELDSLPLWKVKGEEIEIFTAEELTLLLALAPKKLLPYLVIGAFAGLRTAEIERLDWSKVDLEGGYITVSAGIAKTSTRRLVPIAPNLKLWLTDCKTLENGEQRTGKVLEVLNVAGALKRLVTATRPPASADELVDGRRLPPPAVEWKHNALRHSFCSYRLAEVKSAAQVSLEAGNSPQMVFKHYRELVTEKAAKAWFSITPGVAKAVKQKLDKEREEKIVRFPATVAA